MDWHLIRNRNFTATPTKFAPAWFKKLETNLLNPSNEHRLIPAEFILRAHNMKGHEILPIDLSTRALNWIGIWNPVINLPILGRIVKKNEDNRTIIVEHWIIDNNTSTINHPNLTRCNSCQNHNTSFSSIPRTAHIDTYRCANLFTADDAVIIQSSSPKKINNNLYYFDTPQYDIIQRTFYHAMFLHNMLPFYEDTNIIIQRDNYIERFIEKGPIQKELHAIQHSFKDATHLRFFTDGSVIDIGKESMSMSLAFVQTHYLSETREFKATLDYFPSSTRAETTAVLAALLTAPPRISVEILTDSKATMDHYLCECSTVRSFFKEENNVIWSMIRELIRANSLTVTFHKIKAHSGNISNERVDFLAKDAHRSALPLVVSTTALQQIAITPRWRQLPITQHLRHFITQVSRNSGFEKWLNLHRNDKYRTSWVDWEATFNHLNGEEAKLDTSFANSHRKRQKLQLLIEELPTVEHLKK